MGVQKLWVSLILPDLLMKYSLRDPFEKVNKSLTYHEICALKLIYKELLSKSIIIMRNVNNYCYRLHTLIMCKYKYNLSTTNITLTICINVLNEFIKLQIYTN